MATLVEFGHDLSGTTAQRPTNVEIGQRYFDTTIGQQLFYNGTSWVNAGGTSAGAISGATGSRPTSPIAGQTFFNTTTQQMERYSGTAWAPIAGELLCNFRNMIDGGDFQTNPWQRGTSIAGITNSVTYGPDRFCALGGAGSSITLSKAAETSVAGFSQALKFQRANANADTTILKLGQVLETVDCIRAQGQTICLSFWAKAGANFSAASSTIGVKVHNGQGTDQAASNMFAGTWSSQAQSISTTQAITASMVRYSFTGTVPAAATQLGVEINFTPVGSAGADDSVYIHGVQLEVAAAPSAYEFKDVEVELALAQRYFAVIPEVNGAFYASGIVTGTNTQAYSMSLPTQMRTSPTVAVTAGGFSVHIDGAAAVAITSMAAGAAHSPSLINITAGNTVSAAAHNIGLKGTNTTGKITASADY